MVLLKNSLGWFFFLSPPLSSLSSSCKKAHQLFLVKKGLRDVVGEMLLTDSLILQPYNCGSDLIKNHH